MQIEKIEPGANLPVKLEELAKFVLVGREQLTAVRAGIRALDKLDVAEGVRQQKREEAQMLAEALLDAEVRIGEILAAMPKAQGHQENRGNRFKSREMDTGVHFSTFEKQEKTKLEAAKELGFNEKQVQRFQTLAANKDLVEQVKQEAREADDLPTRTAVLQAAKIREREIYIKSQKEEIETGNLQAPEGLFDIISVDPPWPYGREYDPESSRVANPYPEMSIEDIEGIQLPLTKDAVIFLWTTHAFLPHSFKILEKWGATYKATMVWDKQKIGMGVWFRMRCEFCLVGVIGRPYWNNTRFSEVISEPRREHSRKPEQFFELVNSICAGRKLEYFSREKRNDWQNFGNETEKF